MIAELLIWLLFVWLYIWEIKFACSTSFSFCLSYIHKIPRTPSDSPGITIDVVRLYIYILTHCVVFLRLYEEVWLNGLTVFNKVLCSLPVYIPLSLYWTSCAMPQPPACPHQTPRGSSACSYCFCLTTPEVSRHPPRSTFFIYNLCLILSLWLSKL